MHAFDLNQPEFFKTQVRASFDKTPSTYGTNGDFHWHFAARLVERAPIHARQTILDIGTGTGPAAIMVSQRFGNTGQIIGLDLSRGILSIAQRQLTAAHLTNVQLLCGDAENLPFGQAQFDGLLCSSAIVWMPNILRAMEEWHRVLRLGGWLAFSCFGGPARQTTGQLMSQLLKRYGIILPELNGRLNTPEKNQDLLEEAGFAQVQITKTSAHRLFGSPEESYRQSEAGRARFGVTLTTQQERHLKAGYMAELERIASGDDQWNYDYEQFVVAYKPF